MALVLYLRVTNHLSGSDLFVTREIVPSFNVETATHSSLKSVLMQPYT